MFDDEVHTFFKSAGIDILSSKVAQNRESALVIIRQNDLVACLSKNGGRIRKNRVAVKVVQSWSGQDVNYRLIIYIVYVKVADFIVFRYSRFYVSYASEIQMVFWKFQI